MDFLLTDFNLFNKFTVFSVRILYNSFEFSKATAFQDKDGAN